MDLRHPDALKKSLDDRFVNRVFLPEEQNQINQAGDPDCILWVLWAAKETAYKIISKSDPSIHSGPLRYAVYLHDPTTFSLHDPGFQNTFLTCQVESPGGPVMLGVLIGQDYIHTFGCRGDQSHPGTLHLKVFRLDHPCWKEQTESEVVRKSLCRHLGHFWQMVSSRIEVRREERVRGLGPPFVYVDGKRGAADVSLSHHGRFGAFAVFVDDSLFAKSPFPENL